MNNIQDIDLVDLKLEAIEAVLQGAFTKVNQLENQLEHKKLTPAAVLLPLLIKDNQLQVLLTKRSMNLPTHKGEICFPGGKIDPKDKNSMEAALRETYEEVGITPANIEVMGKLPENVTITGFKISPYVGLVQGNYKIKLNKAEIDKLMLVPLNFFCNSNNHKIREKKVGKKSYQFHSFNFNQELIWGATAGMLYNFAATLNSSYPRLFN